MLFNENIWFETIIIDFFHIIMWNYTSLRRLRNYYRNLKFNIIIDCPQNFNNNKKLAPQNTENWTENYPNNYDKCALNRYSESADYKFR